MRAYSFFFKCFLMKGGGETFRMPAEVTLLHALPSNQMDETKREVWMHENLFQRNEAEKLVGENGIPGTNTEMKFER